jgi:hypothetical protein
MLNSSYSRVALPQPIYHDPRRRPIAALPTIVDGLLSPAITGEGRLEHLQQIQTCRGLDADVAPQQLEFHLPTVKFPHQPARGAA